MTSSLVCATPATVASASRIVNVFQPSTPFVSIGTTTPTACAGADVTFIATANNQGSSPIYQWKKNGVNVGTNSSSYTTNVLANGDLISLSMTSSLPCVVTPTVQSNLITMSVNNNTVVPSVVVAASATSICSGQQVTFTATPTNGGTAPNYDWQINGSSVGTNSNTYSSSQLQNNNVVKVIMTSNAQCASPGSATSNLINMVVGTAVSPTISISGLTTVNQNQSTILTASINHGGSLPSYQWQDSTNLHGWQNIGGAINSTLNYIPTLTGNKVRCMLTSNAPCAALSSVTSSPLVFTVSTVTWVEPVPSNNYGVSFYPNPVGETLVVDSLKLLDGWTSLEIYSLDGKSRIITVNISNQTRVTVPVSKLASGLYVVLLKRRAGSAIYSKFIKL